MNNTTDLIRNVFKHREAFKFIVAQVSKFQIFNILIFTWNLEFYHLSQILTIVVFEISGLLC